MKVFKEALDDLHISGERVENIIHGTTLVTNTLIERKGEKTALITTKGFRDVLEIRREKRYDLYDISIEMPEPLVPRNLRFEMQERTRFDGSILTPLDLQQVETVIERLVLEKIGAVAVCFLHSYRNNEHEVKLKEVIGQRIPGLSISLSSECIPEIREYERMSTTVINAYTQPVTKNYLNRIQNSLRELGYKRDSFFVMLSSGGITTREVAEKFPCRIAESGPAAGAILSSFYGKRKKRNKILSFDMGGTTAKICLIEDGKPSVTTDFEVARVYRFKKGSGLPLKLPVIDMIEIGAGGGSIAKIDEMGLLKVGPESAGANPGPVCYDLGGEHPTVTDADLLLGYLNSSHFLGGKMVLDMEKSKTIIRKRLADPLGMSVMKAAYGIRRVVDENMANVARVYAVEKGLDYKAFSLIAFGGQGPNHGYSLAKLLDIKEIIIPPKAGVGSALGFLVSPISFDMVRTYLSPLQKIDIDHLNALFEEMETEGKGLLESAGVPEEKIQIIRTSDMRYVGQGHEISVTLPQGEFAEKSLNEIYKLFAIEYERIFHRVNLEVDIEGLNWRVIAVGPRPIAEIKKATAENTNSEKALKGTRKAYSAERDDFIDFHVYDRYSLLSGMEIEGPAIIEETESTSIIGSDGSAEVDEYQNLIIKIK